MIDSQVFTSIVNNITLSQPSNYQKVGFQIINIDTISQKNIAHNATLSIEWSITRLRGLV
jgi:hypothetical protein